MAKIIQNAVFFKDSRNPKCPTCHYKLTPSIVDYGVENDKMYFVSECGLCDKPVKYLTGRDDFPIKTKIVERKNRK